MLVITLVHIFLRNRVSRFRQKNNLLKCRCNFYSLCSEKNVYHSSTSKFLHKKRHSSEFFTKNVNSVKNSVKFSVKKFYQFYVHRDLELFLHVFLHLYGGEKTGMLKFFSCVHPLIRLFKNFFIKLNFLSCVLPSIRLFKNFL